MQEIIKYQNIDVALRRIERELANSESYKGRALMQQQLREGQAKLLKYENVAANLNAQYNKAVALYNEFLNKLQSLQKQVESVKEDGYADLVAELKSLSQKGETLENNISAMAGRIAAANRDIETIYRQAKVNSDKLKAYKEAYASELAKVEPEVNKLKKELEEQKGKVEPKLLSKYLTKKESKIFPVFVKENKGGCGGCRMEIPAGRLSELKAKGMVECENCGRIIYVE